MVKANLEQQSLLRLNGTTIAPQLLTRRIRVILQKAGVLGAAISVVNHNEIVYKQAFGYNQYNKSSLLQTDTVFYGASLSKPVFSILIFLLVEEGKLDLDRPLLHYLPRGRLKKRTAWWQDFSSLAENSFTGEITARKCLSHTTGLPNWRWHEKDNELSIKFKPGSRYQYSGEGYCLLQYVVEHITGRTVQSLASEKIFQPLGMYQTGYKWHDRFRKNYCNGYDIDGSLFKVTASSEVRAASTLYTTPDDFALFILAVLRKTILPGTLMAAMFKKQVAINTVKQFGDNAGKLTRRYQRIRLGYGLGWGVFKTPFGKCVFKEGHGSGFAHYTALFPDRGIGIAIHSNHYAVEPVYRSLLTLAIGDTFSPLQWSGG